MRWFEQQRIKWIEERKNHFNRSDLMSAFGISTPQASHDIKKYIELYPNKIKYNRKNKYYEVNS